MIDTILKKLNAAQKEAVCFGDGPLLILAGAGSGKTRVITHRVAYLIRKKAVAPDKILCITFTNKAANEMRLRLGKILEKQSSHPFAGTFHSFCAQVLRRHGAAINVSPDYVIWDHADQLAVVKKLLADAVEDNYSPAGILSVISQAKNEMISPLEYVDFAQGPFQEIVAQIYLGYQKTLKLTNGLDFDDLLFKTAKLFKKSPSILEKYQEQYRYLFVDEYQDTNKAQYFLTKLLAQKYGNLCVVGDAAQSIYSWRGADYHNVTRLEKDFPKITTINLERNYRSTQNILDAAYSVISYNKSHPILKLWTKQKSGDKIYLYEAQSGEQEAKFVGREISILKNQGYSLNDIAILYRTNAQSRLIEKILLHYNIPYQLVGGFRFYERQEVKDILAFLRFVFNRQDSVSEDRIKKIGKRIYRRVVSFAELVDEKKERPKTIDVLDGVLRRSGYLDKYSSQKEEDQSRLENIKELRSVAMEFADLTQFLENVALMEQEYFPNGNSFGNLGEEDKVTLMTLHSAKGTESPVIFIVGVEEGLLPHSRSLFHPQEIEEERRLCYVGITRAKEKLFLTWASSRFLFGKKNYNSPSRFLADIPEELIENLK